MIVISGALVLVALVLLVVGLTMTELDFVYGSIAVSLLAFVFLVIGILQRRGEQVPAAGSAPAPTAGNDDAPAGQAVSAPVDVSKRPAVEPEAPLEDDDVDEELLEGGGTVLVVAGRPRYHVDGCRYLNGKDVEEVDVLDARDEGFTPCGVCKPDEVLAAELAAEAEEGDLVDEEGLAEEEQLVTEEALAADDEDVDDTDEDAADEDEDADDVADLVEADVQAAGDDQALEPAATRALALPETAPATKAARTSAKATAKAPARSAAARSVPAAAKAPGAAAKAPAKAVKAAKAPAAKAAKAPAKAATKAATSTPAAASAAKNGTVVVIPDRGRFHRAECRYVRDADDALELSKAAATKQGYAACGVCKP